jgi:hypothetical protein
MRVFNRKQSRWAKETKEEIDSSATPDKAKWNSAAAARYSDLGGIRGFFSRGRISHWAIARFHECVSDLPGILPWL